MFRLIYYISLSLWTIGIIMTSHSVSASITNYKETFIPGYDKEGKLQIAIRSYNIESAFKFLVVNPYSFKTMIVEANDLALRNPHPNHSNSNSFLTMGELEQTPYIKALKRYTSPPYKIENYGLTYSSVNAEGVFLTIDMCPSSKYFEQNFFDTLVTLKDKIKKPAQIAIALSGMWALRHQEEFDWLIDQQRKGNLYITWINHSFSHIYYKDLPIQENFMLSQPKSNISEEILSVERILLNKGELPSVFIRFPGLISNEDLISELKRFGLIPIGSNAWLAREEGVKRGSIILVHGNSNEPQGIKMLLPMLTSQSPITLLPLYEIFQE